MLFELFTEAKDPAERPPYARLAQAGTVLLQDVWRLTPALQRRFADHLVSLRTAGSHGQSRRRLMASSAEPLLPRVLDGTFDDRLFYRLNVIHVVLAADRPA
jgi:DNA-binding NtrC family response regulator